MQCEHVYEGYCKCTIYTPVHAYTWVKNLFFSSTYTDISVSNAMYSKLPVAHSEFLHRYSTPAHQMELAI